MDWDVGHHGDDGGNLVFAKNARIICSRGLYQGIVGGLEQILLLLFQLGSSLEISRRGCFALLRADGFELLRFSVYGRHRIETGVCASTRLVHYVDGLVGLHTVGYITAGKGDASLQRLIGIDHIVVLLIFGLQSLEYIQRLLIIGRFHQNLLESALQGTVLLNYLTVLIQSRGADALNLAAGQGGFEQVGGVQAARLSACTD